MSDAALLNALLWLPVAGLLGLALLPLDSEVGVRRLTFVVTSVQLALAGWLLVRFDGAVPGLQFATRLPWISAWGVGYHIGLDGLNVLLVALTAFLGPLVVAGAVPAVRRDVKLFHAMLLFIQFAMLGTLVAQDLFLFYVFWEAMLIPLFLIIGIWGGERRIYATMKFVLYTAFGSILMLTALIYLIYSLPQTGDQPSFAFEYLYRHTASAGVQRWLFAAFAVSFAIKVPIVPLHTWLPDAHVEAPTAGSVILAGVLLKMGTYGFLRFSLPLCPDALFSNARFLGLTTVGWVAALSIVGIVYGSMVAMVQKDMKKLVAYSSVAHLGFVMLGLFALNNAGIQGGILQSINHGLSTGGLFLLVGIIYERRHTRMIADYGGLSGVMPVYAMLFMVILLASIGLPLLNGFVGEFTILTGVFLADWRWAAWASLGVILGAAYMLWLYQRVFFGEMTHEENKGLEDVNLREILTLAPLIVMCFWIGVYPKPFFEMTAKSAEKIVATVSAPGLRRAAREAAPRLAGATSSSATSTGIPAAAAAAAAAAPAAVAEVK